MTTEIFSLYSGRVKSVEKVKDGKWIVVSTEKAKPVALLSQGFTGELPKVGNKISIEAREGILWWFGEHRSMVITKIEPRFPLEGLPNNNRERNRIVVDLILDWLDTHPQVTASDVYDEAMLRTGNQTDLSGRWKVDPRFLGHAFRLLAKHKMIHQIGYKRSVNHTNHGRPQATWELTKK